MSLSPGSILLNALGRFLGQSATVDKGQPLIVQPDYYYKTDFGEQRVANAYTLFDLVNKYEIDASELETSTATGGTVTFDGTNSAVNLAVTASNGSTARLRTSTYFRYQAGKEFVVKLTATQNALVANQTRRLGMFDDADGVFFQTTDTAISVNIRSSSSVTSQSIDRSVWNIDKLDGTGPSGKTLDITAGNIYEIHFQWLGVGAVRYYINGDLVHVISNAGLYTGPYMRIAQLPLSWEIINTGASTISAMKVICASVLIMGGADPPAQVNTAFNPAARTVGTVTEVPVLSIRPKQNYAGITNRALLYPTMLEVSCEGNRAGYRIALNPTLTGATFAATVPATSKMDADIAATSFAADGITLLRGFLSGTNDGRIIDLRPIFNVLDRKLRRSAFNPANGDILSIGMINENTSGNTTARASLVVREVGLCTRRLSTSSPGRGFSRRRGHGTSPFRAGTGSRSTSSTVRSSS